MSKAFLVLEDGTQFEGRSIGAKGVTVGELCFNTGMTGYQEIFTDPSYARQLVLFTNVHLGNYGIHKDEFESDKAQVSGIIVRNFENKYSRLSAIENVQAYLEANSIVGIANVDTRAIVKYIREKGAMLGAIVNDSTDMTKVVQILKNSESMSGLELASEVTTSEPYLFGDHSNGVKLAVLDYGVKQNMLRCLNERGFDVKVFPSNTTIDVLNEWDPDGYFLSNGPGDPSVMQDSIKTAQNIFNTKKPVFGICLGHQIMCLAKGLKTYKMHHGHRGLNHPVINLETGISEITSQNHGFSVDLNSAQANDSIKVTHVNLNDDTLEGVRYLDENGFSVQFHPESSPGPHDSRYLFDNFKSLFKN